MLRGQLGCSPLLLRPLHEVRYPYLDRDLLEFLWSIPREQIVRPGQRRSLVRRALAGIVPDELLNRRRKAFLSRAPLAAVEREWGDLETMSREMRSDWFGFVDAPRFREAMGMAREGSLQFTVAFWRTVALESWLRSVERYVQARKPSRKTASGLLVPIGFSAEKN